MTKWFSISILYNFILLDTKILLRKSLRLSLSLPPSLPPTSPQMWMSVAPCRMLAGWTCAAWTRTEATCVSPAACTTSPTGRSCSRSQSPSCTRTPRWASRTASSPLSPDRHPATRGWDPLRSASWDMLLQRMAPAMVSRSPWCSNGNWNLKNCDHLLKVATFICP